MKSFKLARLSVSPPSLRAFVLPGGDEVYQVNSDSSATSCGFDYSPRIPGLLLVERVVETKSWLLGCMSGCFT